MVSNGRQSVLHDVTARSPAEEGVDVLQISSSPDLKEIVEETPATLCPSDSSSTTQISSTRNLESGSSKQVELFGNPTGSSIDAIESMLPYLKFYHRTVDKLVHDCRGVSNRYGLNDRDFVEALKKLHLLVVRLSTSGLALLIAISTVSSEIEDIRVLLRKVDTKLPQVTAAAAVTDATIADVGAAANGDVIRDASATTEYIEMMEKNELEEAQTRLKKLRVSADKLFGEYKIRPNHLRKFVLSDSYLVCDEYSVVAMDDISLTFEGEIVQDPNAVEKVHVKCLTEIGGGSTEEIIQRTIFLTHLLRSCENIMRPRFVVMPNLILLEPNSYSTLAGYQLDHAQKIDVTLKIAGALALVHSYNIVHRDVRAANVIMSPTVQDDGTLVVIPKLTGFEVCRHIGYDITHGSVRETVWHGPERVLWHSTSFKTDVFAFGVLMYEISMGHEPTMMGTSVTETDVQDWIAQESGNVSEDYSNLMRQCLEIDYPRRLEMRQVVERLEQVVAFEYQSTSQ
ncbi:hypothetical protein BGZ73_000412 [Actinomortierella ambigua]|nr:hypothetical protein BGZ73_000412 [Actinomortierella ambigua]